MTVTIDAGQLLTAITLALFAYQARQALAELRTLRLDVTHLQRWAAREWDYQPRDAS